jgi:hypothetical protein
MTAVVAGEFEDKLKAAGISPEAIDILVKQEFTSVGDLGSLTVESLVGMGIKHGTAQKIVANFGKKEPQPFDKMPLPDLLKYLVNNPRDDNALKALKQQEAVQKAATKTPNWAVMGIEDKKLDVSLTLAYLDFLKSSSPRDTYRGKAVVSIEVALGQTDDVILNHPVLDEKLSADGVDSNDLNWLTVPVEVRKALFWAQVTGHALFPKNPAGEVFEVYKEATKNPLEAGRVKKIVTEYQAAVLREDPAAVKIQSLKMPAK